MWLKRLVGIFMILTCIGLNVLTLLGIVVPDKNRQLAAQVQQAAQQTVTAAPVAQAPGVPAPSVTLTAKPTSISAGSSSGLTWSTTGGPACTASGSWSGEKTPFGSESTGRISSPGNYTYTLSCSNAGGKSVATAVVSVGNAPPPPKIANVTTTTGGGGGGALHCGGRLPCYGPKDLAAHGAGGNCWGWNGDRVINLSGFDAAYHAVKSGIASIQTSQVCGHDLAPSLNGQVSAGGKTRVHTQASKNNSDANEIPYFVGYYDASK